MRRKSTVHVTIAFVLSLALLFLQVPLTVLAQDDGIGEQTTAQEETGTEATTEENIETTEPGTSGEETGSTGAEPEDGEIEGQDEDEDETDIDDDEPQDEEEELEIEPEALDLAYEPQPALSLAMFSGSIMTMAEGNESLSITVDVSGSGIPDADTVFIFSITKDDAPAEGFYSIGGGEAQAIPADGKFQLKAGETAVFTKLSAGEYVITEELPEQPNYDSTTFTVNGSAAQTGRTATVTVTAPAPSSGGGWLADESGQLTIDGDGYFVYTVTPGDVVNGKVSIDCDPLAEYMEYFMRRNLATTIQRFKLKIVNNSGGEITYDDYEFRTVNWIGVGDTYIPSDDPQMANETVGNKYCGWGGVWQQLLPMFTGIRVVDTTLNAEGFDGNNVRLATAPLRTINPAIVSYFRSNPGTGTGSQNPESGLTNKGVDSVDAGNMTLKQMNAFPELIKEDFTFNDFTGSPLTLEADSNRTYADFIRAFYRVNSLDELTVTQKYNVLGTGHIGSPGMAFAGQSAITTYYATTYAPICFCIPASKFEAGNYEFDYFKAWGFSNSAVKEGGSYFKDNPNNVLYPSDYAYQADYFLMENDPEILAMGYEYLYERGIRFTFDHEDRPISSAPDNGATPVEDVCGLMSYIDKTPVANSHVAQAMNGLQPLEDGDAIVLDNIRAYIEVPNAWNQYRFFDFGFSLTFLAEDIQTEEAPVVVFTNIYSVPSATTSPSTTGGGGGGDSEETTQQTTTAPQTTGTTTIATPPAETGTSRPGTPRPDEIPPEIPDENIVYDPDGVPIGYYDLDNNYIPLGVKPENPHSGGAMPVVPLLAFMVMLACGATVLLSCRKKN